MSFCRLCYVNRYMPNSNKKAVFSVVGNTQVQYIWDLNINPVSTSAINTRLGLFRVFNSGDIRSAPSCTS